MIRVEHLTYEYPGKRALDDVSFHIPAGSITALVGPNGAGKTTLLRCIAALDEPFSGQIHVAGLDVARNPRLIHQKLGYLSDSFGLYEDLTVLQCLIFMARLHHLPDDKLVKQIEWASQMLELAPYLDKKAGSLSRGWRQRVGIAQAIIHMPELLLLDEPASGLDPEARLTLSALFRTLNEQGMTLVVSSHILAELEDYCTDMLILRNGKVVERQAPNQTQAKQYNIEIAFLDAAEPFAEQVSNHPQVSSLLLQGSVMQITFSGDSQAQHVLLKQLLDQGASIHSFGVTRHRLQDVYMTYATESSQ